MYVIIYAIQVVLKSYAQTIRGKYYSDYSDYADDYLNVVHAMNV